MKEELTSQIAALSSGVDSRLAAMEEKLEEGRLDKQQFVSCEELAQEQDSKLVEQDDKLTANATSSGWPTMQQQCHQQVFGLCWMRTS
jgi:hypothetical protein